MKQLLVIAALGFSLSSIAQTKPTTLKSVLLAQLKTTHNVQDWFVPINQSLEGLTPEQAIWKDKKDNHSVAELATHLLFWDKQQLAKFKGVRVMLSTATTPKHFLIYQKRNGLRC